MSSNKAEFVHLHTHSEYSLLDGALKLEILLSNVNAQGYHAIAITDHGNLFGAIKFYYLAKKFDIKPIIGCEVYVALDSRFKHDKSTNDQEIHHLTLLAKNMKGYKNLVRLVTAGYLEGFYYRPRVDKELISQLNEGLICLSGCMRSELSVCILQGKIEQAYACARWYKDIFGEDYYIELLDQGLPQQETLNKQLCEIAKSLDIKVVATNDVHYLNKQDSIAHDILLCIQTNKKVTDKTRLRFQSDEYYLKTQKAMQQLFSHIPEAIKNTLKIADECEFELEERGFHLPRFCDNSFERLKELCQNQLCKTYGSQPPKKVTDRLNYELSIIEQLGFEDYFLIVADITDFARRNGIDVGPGRGSVAGSLVAYLLQITAIDPIEHDLLFERFLNPQRHNLPDIDIDIEDLRRGEVLEYIRDRWGHDRVAQIITFGTLSARAVVRDVGRALGLPYTKIDTLAKQLDANLPLQNYLPKFKNLIAGDTSVRQLIEIALQLEGLCRHASVHAAGIVIAPTKLIDFLPLYCDRKTNTLTTQYDKDSLEKIGLLKMDILGLKTLTLIKQVIYTIKHNYAKDITNDTFNFSDPKVWEILQRGDTTGVFQLESKGMRELLRRSGVENFSELVAILALHRPGPINSGMVDEFIKHKTNSQIKYLHPMLQDILEETYGVVIYQEQVMRIAQKLANFSLAQADILRAAMAKKIPQKMQELRSEFIRGAKSCGIPREQSEQIFALLEQFCEYCFNKSHSTAYAILAFQTAYLKAHYPLEFNAALLDSEINSLDKLRFYISEIEKSGITILPPDINLSTANFTPENGNSIRYALSAIKHIGTNVVSEIQRARGLGKFSSFIDFCERVDLRVVNKRAIETLVKCGAFDSFGYKRSQLLAGYEKIVEHAAKIKQAKTQYQQELFSTEGVSEYPPLPDLPELPEDILCKFEQELLAKVFFASLDIPELHIRLRETVSQDKEKLKDLYNILKQSQRGDVPIYLHLYFDDRPEVVVHLPQEFNVKPKTYLINSLTRMEGVELL